ncbi:hypothetical protein FRC14_000435 [Serendipita sp. 396]|nr:hypothetical protein FRC14_000435 [Serendipita sp. 396]
MNIDRYLTHSGQGWQAPAAPSHQRHWEDDGGVVEDDGLLRRHAQLLRAPYDPDYDVYGHSGSRRHARREASDVSVEALDLADYAQTLRRAEAARNDPYPPHNVSNNRPFTREPWSPIASPSASPPVPDFGRRAFSPPSLPYPPVASMPIDRPFSALSRDTMMPPPSLVSTGTTSQSSHTNATSINHPLRRPFSLPADYPNRGPAIFNQRSPPPRAVGTGRRVHADPLDFDPAITEPDISSFPPWARKWYAQEEVANRSSPKGKGKNRDTGDDEIFGPYIQPNTSHRDLGLLPWATGNEDQPAVGNIPDNVKEERIRMLEKEFGDKATDRGWKQAQAEEEMIGGVDAKGNLITVGPKKRAATRWLQAIFAIATAVSGIYGAFFIKLKSPAPPSGRAAAYILYVLSILTPLLLFFFFVISPFCLNRNKKDVEDSMTTPSGMMVLPVNQGKSSKKKKDKKGKGGQDGQGSVQVNLIVDPGMFDTNTGRRRAPPGAYDEDDYDEDFVDETSNPSSRRKGRRRRREDRDDIHERAPRRRSVFAGLAMERAWRRARSQLKKRLALDVVMTITWAACFVMILLGQRCPPGTLDGWCDAYNIATAGASVLVVLFATSVFFDAKDLHQSKVSPRTRL